MSGNNNHYHISLIHQTDQNCAEQIISSQKMIPSSNGLYGPGIYFANTIEAANLKNMKRHMITQFINLCPKKTKVGKILPKFWKTNKQQQLRSNLYGIF